MDIRLPIQYTSSKILYVLTTPQYSSIVEKELSPAEWAIVAEFIDWVGSTSHGTFEAVVAQAKDKYGTSFRSIDRVLHERQIYKDLPVV